MVPAPMRPAQNALAIFALFLVAGALYPWGAQRQSMCAASAIAIVLALFLARLRAHGTRVADPSDAALATRVARIRADRDSRMGRGSR